MHILLTGKPASGKTTLLKSLLLQLPGKIGFFTEEVREKERLGFKVVTLEGKEAIFAHRDFKSPYKVSAYGVDLMVFNTLVLKELRRALDEPCNFVVIDELGKMELFSEEFKAICLKILERKRVFGTISLLKDPFLDAIRKRKDVCILNVTAEEFEMVKEKAKMALESLSVAGLRALEQAAKEIGLDERLLIENASSNLTHTINGLMLGKKIVAVAGKGNNGADTLACARKLLALGYEIKAVIVKDGELGLEVLFQKAILENLKVPLYVITETNLNKLKTLIADSEVIIDGILGIGAKGEVSPFLKMVIAVINDSHKRVVACDIPSGLAPDTGAILGAAIKADYTITFIAPKYGFFLKDGQRLCGKLFVVDIGVPRHNW